MEPGEQSSPDASERQIDRGNGRPSKRTAPRGTAAYPRQRAVTACQVCRARRTKCDNLKPKCTFCAKTGADCSSAPSDFSAFDPASLKILERLDELERLLRKESVAKLPQPSNSHTSHSLVLPPRTHVPEHIETILDWPVFQERFNRSPSLTSLLSGSTPFASVGSPATFSCLLVEDFDHKTCFRLLENFLQNVHVKNPLFEEVYARQLMRRICLDGIGRDVQSCLALLICALGSLAVPFESPVIEMPDRASFSQAQAYFNAAQKRLGMLLSCDGVYEAQCFFWSGVYLISIMQPLSAWRMFVQALTCCQGFKFASRSAYDNRDKPESLSYSTADPTLEERVYWSCWKSERELRGELQPPDFKIDALDYPRSFPTPPQNSVGIEHVSWCFYLAEISLLRLRIAAQSDALSVTGAQDPSSLHGFTSTISVHEARIESWTHSLPSVITLENPQSEDDILKFILRGHLLNSYEILYSSLVRCLLVEGICSSNIKVYAIKGLQIHVDRLKINRPGFRHRHHGTWGMLRSCTRSALLLLAAAYHEYACQIIPRGWQEAVLAAIDMLEYWRYETRDVDDRLSIIRELWDGLQLR